MNRPLWSLLLALLLASPAGVRAAGQGRSETPLTPQVAPSPGNRTTPVVPLASVNVPLSGGVKVDANAANPGAQIPALPSSTLVPDADKTAGQTLSPATPAEMPPGARQSAPTREDKPPVQAAGSSNRLPPTRPGLSVDFDDRNAFLKAMVRRGLPQALADDLLAYLDKPGRHPGDQKKVYHGRQHTSDVPNGLAAVLEGMPDVDDATFIKMLLAAALHDIDPDRPLESPARVSATLPYLAKDAESQALLAQFAKHLGMSPQDLLTDVSIPIKKTDFHPDAKVREQIEADYQSLLGSRHPEGAARDRMNRLAEILAFVDKTVTYFADPDDAERQVVNLAHEYRIGVKEGTLPPNTFIPTVEGTHGFLTNFIVKSPYYGLLPADLKARFEKVLAHFQRLAPGASQGPQQAQAPTRGPPITDKGVTFAEAEAPKLVAGTADASHDAAWQSRLEELTSGARRFIRNVMGARKPTSKQADALLKEYLEQRNVFVGTRGWREVRAAVLPDLVKAEAEAFKGRNPLLLNFAPLIVSLSEDFGVTPAHVESVLNKHGGWRYLSGQFHLEEVEDKLFQLLYGDKVRTTVAAYPKNKQGDALREVAQHVLVKSGKSLEEVSRAGAFLYADFAGQTPTRLSAGRDPDNQAPHVLFYMVFRDGQWKIDVYRQNRRASLGSDFRYVEALRRWLLAGGIPEEQLAP